MERISILFQLQFKQSTKSTFACYTPAVGLNDKKQKCDLSTLLRDIKFQTPDRQTDRQKDRQTEKQKEKRQTDIKFQTIQLYLLE